MSLKGLAKPFTIAGFVAGEAYMLYTALAPNLKGGPAVPWDAILRRCLSLACFFGPFGAAVGLGGWLLIAALAQSFGGAQEDGTGDEPSQKL